ncbi:MAG: hypothetical protein ACK5MY_01435 [Jhaorihella sp.]
MELVADILLVAGALGAGLYCFVLARRLNRFNDLERGVGGAVAVLSAQVDDLNLSLIKARETSESSNTALNDLTDRAEGVAKRLELLMASMHDVPGASGSDAPAAPLAASSPPDQPQPAPEAMFVRHDRNQREAAQ